MSPSSPSATSEQHYLQENFKTLLQLCPKTVSIPRLQSYDDEYMKKERECTHYAIVLESGITIAMRVSSID